MRKRKRMRTPIKPTRKRMRTEKNEDTHQTNQAMKNEDTHQTNQAMAEE